jgi:arylsulfatase A-like enzyme
MLSDTWRWARGLLATALWSFVLAGMLGMAEGLSQWFRFDVLSEGGPGFVRTVAPTVALYGWVAMLIAALFYTPFYFMVRRRSHPRRQAYAYSISTVLGLFCFFYTGYLVREHIATDWWLAHQQDMALVIQAVIMILAATLLAKPIIVLASRQVLNPWRNIFLAVVFVVVFTSLWPNWREEGRERRLTDLERGETTGLADRPNLVLVTIDTLRRDAISAIDADAPPTPGLDAIADEGIVYTNFWSSSCWTLPAMGTVMTGHAPRTLGMSKYTGLPADVTTLAQTAWCAGYRTAAFASNPYLTPTYGFDLGFEVFEHALVLEPLIPATRSVFARELDHLASEQLELDDAQIVIGKTIRWLEARDDDAPFFLWIHLMDPHVTYRWQELPDDAPDIDPARGIPADRDEVPDHPLFEDGCFPGENLSRVRDALPDLSAAARTGLKTLYRREVQYTDACLSRLWRALQQQALWDETVLVVTSDHGEEFFEHGGFEHGHTFMPEVTGVPLIVRLPGNAQAGTRVDTDHDHTDLVPSLCRTMGWPTPADLPGNADLLTFGSADSIQHDPAVLEYRLYGEGQYAIRDWPYYGIDAGDGTAPTWYRLDTDPGAQRPLLAAPDRGDEIMATAQTRRDAWDKLAETFSREAGDESSLGETLRRQLRSLGY